MRDFLLKKSTGNGYAICIALSVGWSSPKGTYNAPSAVVDMQRIFAKKTPTTCSYCPFVDSFVYGFFSCSQANRRGIQPFYDALRETVIRCAVEGDSFGITNFVHRTLSPSTRPEPATSCTAARLFFTGIFSPTRFLPP